MSKILTLPALGDDKSTEGEIISLVDIGQAVSVGDILMEVETDKVVVEIPATDAGTITHLEVKIGDRVSGGIVFATIDAGDKTEQPTATTPSTEQASASATAETVKADAPRSTSADTTSTIETLALPAHGDDGTVLSIKAAGERFSQHDILLEVETDKTVMEVPAPFDGTITELLVKEGQVVSSGMAYCKVSTTAATPEVAPAPAPAPEEKVTAAPAQATTQAPVTPASANEPESSIRPAVDVNIPAGPAARRLARTLGINIGQVQGTGARDRITKDDITKHAKNLIQQKPGQYTAPSRKLEKALPDISQFGSVRRESMSGIAKATSRNMQFAWSEIPHAWVQEDIDITELEALRKQIKQSNRGDMPLTVTAILCKVVALALKRFPAFNSVLDTNTDEVIFRDYINIGVAVDTPRGLVVPCLRDVDGKTSVDIGFELKAISEKAVASKLTAQDFQGSGFTISNLGGLGVSGMFPVVNWPEVAIMGVSSSRARCELRNGQVENRLIMPLTLGFDHRVINGADAARFLGFIRECIEQPALLLINR